MSNNAKARLKQILSGPEPGTPWKLDVPDDFPDEAQFPIPHNFWARGLLIELHQFKKVYKPKGYTHRPNAIGYDYKSPKWAQMKSAAIPNTANAIKRMEKAIVSLVQEATEEGGSTAEMILHIVTKDADNGAMRTALDAFLEGKSMLIELRLLLNQ